MLHHRFQNCTVHQDNPIGKGTAACCVQQGLAQLSCLLASTACLQSRASCGGQLPALTAPGHTLCLLLHLLHLLLAGCHSSFGSRQGFTVLLLSCCLQHLLLLPADYDVPFQIKWCFVLDARAAVAAYATHSALPLRRRAAFLKWSSIPVSSYCYFYSSAAFLLTICLCIAQVVPIECVPEHAMATCQQWVHAIPGSNMTLL